MKTKKKISLFALLFCVLLFATALVSAAHSVAIVGHNLSLTEDEVKIVYYVDTDADESVERGMLFWLSPQEAYIFGTEDYRIPVHYGTYQKGEETYLRFAFGELTAAMMTDDVYAVAYVKDGEEITYSALDKYSVLQYAVRKKDSDTVVRDDLPPLGELLTALLEEGAAAQTEAGYHTDRLATATYYQIKVVNGTFADGAALGLFQAGTEITLTAAPAPEGQSFSHWENAAGEQAGADETIEVSVSEDENYTAVYQNANFFSQGLAFTSNGDGTCYVSGIGTCTDTDVVVPPTSPDGDVVTRIGDSAFNNCTDLTSVTFGENSQLTFIGQNAFRNCSNLTSIVIPDTVTIIAFGAFYGCSDLQAVTLPAGISAIETYSFYECSKLQSIVIPNQVTRISTEAFFACYALETIVIGDEVRDIAEGAFRKCTNLRHLTIGESVNNIGANAFEGCWNIEKVCFGGNISNWCQITFKNDYSSPIGLSQKTKFYIDDQLLTDLIVPNGVTSINKYSFEGYHYLKTLTISDSVSSIYAYSFAGCDKLISVTVGENVTYIAQNAFYNCRSLLEVYNKSSLNIKAGATANGSVGYYAKAVYTEPYDSKLSTNKDGYIIYTDGETSILIGYTGSETNLILPNEITEINPYAFYGCSDLASVEIPDSVTYIGVYAFANCTDLASVTFHNTIGWWCASSSTATDAKDIASSGLSDPSQAATYLRLTYYYYYWKRS